MMNNRTPETGEKRKRGRPRVDKTSPEYLARKKARELGEFQKFGGVIGTGFKKKHEFFACI